MWSFQIIVGASGLLKKSPTLVGKSIAPNQGMPIWTSADIILL